MAVKLFLRNFHFYAYYKLSKLTFSEKNTYFFGKVHSDVNVYVLLFSGFTSYRAVFFVTRASETFRANLQ